MRYMLTTYHNCSPGIDHHVLACQCNVLQALAARGRGEAYLSAQQYLAAAKYLHRFLSLAELLDNSTLQADACRKLCAMCVMLAALPRSQQQQQSNSTSNDDTASADDDSAAVTQADDLQTLQSEAHERSLAYAERYKRLCKPTKVAQ